MGHSIGGKTMILRIELQTEQIHFGRALSAISDSH